jgi:putative Holliday junction resolvase
MAVVLGLDVGERRIGVAVSDATGLLASPLTTVMRSSDAEAVRAISRLADERGATELVVGLPLGREGEMTPQAERIHAFGRKLRAVPGARVVFWDETLSTATAADYLAAIGKGEAGARSGRQREMARRRLDAAAAAVILQEYLDHQRGAPTESPDPQPE